MVQRTTGRRHAVADLVLMPPVLTPSKILCVGQNYRTHIKEQHGEVPIFPLLFNNWPATLIGPRDAVVLPQVPEQADREVELAFDIATRLRGTKDHEDA